MDKNTMITMRMILMETKIETMTKEDLNNIVWVDNCPVCNGDGLDSDKHGGMLDVGSSSLDVEWWMLS